MKVNRLIILPLIIIALAALYLLAFVTRGEVVVDFSSLDPNVALESKVTINNTQLEPSGSGGVFYKLKVWPGKYNIAVYRPFFETYQTQVSAGFVGRSTVVPEFNKVGDDQTASDIYQVSESEKITNIVRYDATDGSKWISFFVVLEGTESDQLQIIAKYSDELSQWETVAEGTGIDRESIKDAPEEFIGILGL